MKKFTTYFHAIKPETGELVLWQGPHVEALTAGMAQAWCKENAGHLAVEGELVSEIPTKEDGITPDRAKTINYDVENN